MASGNDMESAKETYNGFTVFVKWGSIVCILAVALVITLLVS